MKRVYHHTQKNGSSFTIQSDNTPAEEIRANKNLGSGLAFLRVKVGDDWQDVYDHRKDFPISELRIVQVWSCCPVDPLSSETGEYRCAQGAPSEYLMHESQVDTFVQATIKLHHTHGNPLTRKLLPSEKNQEVVVIFGQKYTPLRNLWEIRVAEVNLYTSSYWWCSPDLMKNQDPNGAQLNDTHLSRRVWAHPDLLKDEAAREAME